MPVQCRIFNSLKAVFLCLVMISGAGHSAVLAQNTSQNSSQTNPQNAILQSGETAEQTDCPGPVYDTGFLAVDQMAQTGQLARETAMQEVTRSEFERLLGRMLLVPTAETLSVFSDVNPADFVDFVQIDEETVLPGRYIANLRICFNQINIREALLAKQLDFAEVVSPPVLVMPLFAEPTGIRLFMRSSQNQRAQSQNAWFDGWAKAISAQQGLVELVSLENSLALSRRLREENAYQAEEEVLKLAAQSSDARQLLWVLAELDYSQQTPRLVLDARLYDANGRLLAPIAKQAFDLNGQHNMNLLFRDFQADILSQLESEWRRANLVSFTGENELILAVPFTDFADWYDKQRKIASLPVIIDVMPIHLDAQLGLLKITPAGSLQAVESGFAGLGFGLGKLDDYQQNGQGLQQLLLVPLDKQ